MGTKTLLTVDEFLQLPDEPGKQELLGGEVIALPPAKIQHTAAIRRMSRFLERNSDEDRVWVEAGFRLSASILQPDIAVTWPEQKHAPGDYHLGAPMIAIEVASPGNAAPDLESKVQTYLKEGAAEVWVIFPSLGSMTVHTSTQITRITETYTCSSLGVTVDLPKLLADLPR
jgi:Uma2 family endonuclease